MPHRSILPLLAILLWIVLLPSSAWSHGGGLDSYGCHHDRKADTYHCHRGEFAGRSFASQAEMLASRQQSYTAFPPTLPTLQFSGKVVGVTDGDTITVLHNGKGARIRLYGIDCPEKRQAFGNRAKQFTSEMVFSKEVTVKVYGHDQYGRTIGEILLPDGTNLNHELVKAGFAWWYRKYAPRDKELARLEFEARDVQRGLWVDPHPIPPWEWRKRTRHAQ